MTPAQVAAVAATERAVIARRVAGEQFVDIDKALGITNSDRVYKRAIEKLPRESREDALRLEQLRLDKVHASFWSDTEAGDPKAAAVVLGVSDRRAKLIGLNHADRNDDARLQIEAAQVQMIAGVLVQALKAAGVDQDTGRQIITTFGELLDSSEEGLL